ncbi:MAG: glycosyltransferase family 2 protein [Patescibacteria group bacterium]
MNNKISVIIVSWNVADKLRRCLKAVLSEQPYEVVVIDNASRDNTVAMVKNYFPTVKLIAAQENLGFAKACNQGLKKVSGDIILLLNPDTFVWGGGFNKVIDFFNEHKHIGIVGGQLINGHGVAQQSVRRLPTLWSQIAVLLKLGYLCPWLLNKYLIKDFNYNQDQEVEQVSGAFFYINKLALNEIGSFDESFWLWFEEVDLCKRAKEAGWQIWYAAQVKAENIGGASFKQLSHLERQKIFNNSLCYYFKKHSSRLSYFILRLLSPISLAQAVILDLIKL